MGRLAENVGAKERGPVAWTGAPSSPKRTWPEKDGRSPISANLFARQSKSKKTLVFCISNSPQKRHPERSASQIYRMTKRLMARSRRTSTVLVLPMPFGPFQPLKPAPGGPATISKAGDAKRSSTSLARSIPSSKTLHRPGDGR
jgi:hypothetical protein